MASYVKAEMNLGVKWRAGVSILARVVPIFSAGGVEEKRTKRCRSREDQSNDQAGHELGIKTWMELTCYWRYVMACTSHQVDIDC